MPKMAINDSPSSMASNFSSLLKFFDARCGSSFLTETELSLDDTVLVGRRIRYAKGDFRAEGVVVSVTSEKVFTV